MAASSCGTARGAGAVRGHGSHASSAMRLGVVIASSGGAVAADERLGLIATARRYARRAVAATDDGRLAPGNVRPHHAALRASCAPTSRAAPVRCRAARVGHVERRDGRRGMVGVGATADGAGHDRRWGERHARPRLPRLRRQALGRGHCVEPRALGAKALTRTAPIAACGARPMSRRPRWPHPAAGRPVVHRGSRHERRWGERHARPLLARWRDGRRSRAADFAAA